MMPPKKSGSVKGGLNYESLIHYMKYSTYPKEVKSEHEKRNIRKRAKSFLLDGDKLFFVCTDDSNLKTVKEVVYTHESQQRVFKEFHIDEKGTHLGREKLLNLITEKYYWQGICHKIREFLHECKECQEKTEAFRKRMAVMETITKTENYMTPELDMEIETESVASVSFSDSWITSSQPSLEPQHFWDIVEVKLLGPYLCNDRMKYVMVFMDVFSLWPEAAIVETMSSTVVTHVVINLICRFGVMKKLLLGVEKLETEQLMPRTDILATENINIEILNMSATHTVEAWNEIRETMHHFVANNPDWTNCLSFALLPHRISRGRNAEYSPAFLTYGRELNLPSSLSHQPEEEYLRVSDTYIPMEMKKDTLDTLLSVYKGYCGPVNISQESDVFKTPKSSTRLLRTRSTKKRSSVAMEADYTTGNDITSEFGSRQMSSEQINTDGISESGEENLSIADHEIKQEVDSSEEKDESPMYTVKRKRWSRTHRTSMDNSSNKSGDLTGDELQAYEKLLEITDNSSPEKLMISEDTDPTYEPLLLYLNHRKYPEGVNEHKKRMIRKMAESYYIEDEVLYHRWKATKRVVPLRFDERYYILQSYHVDDKGKHVGFKYMNEKLHKYHWKSMVADCEAYVRTCLHCNQTKSTNHESLPEFFYDDTDEKRAKLAEENYSLLVKYLQKGKLVQSVQPNKSRLISLLAKWFTMKNGQLYYKRPHNEYEVCLEVASRAKKNAIRDAHVTPGLNQHASQTETLQTLSEKYIWCGMRENCEDFVATCCKQSKPTDIKRSATFKKFDLQQRVSLFQKIREMQDDPQEAEKYNNIKTKVLEKYNKILSENSCNDQGQENSCNFEGQENSCSVEGQENSCSVEGEENMEVDKERHEDESHDKGKSTDSNRISQSNPKPSEMIGSENNENESQHQILNSENEQNIAVLEEESTTKQQDSTTDVTDQAVGMETQPESNNFQIPSTSGENAGLILASENSQQVISGTPEKPTEQMTTDVQHHSVLTNEPSNSTAIQSSQQDMVRCENSNHDNSESRTQAEVNTTQQEVEGQLQRVLVEDATATYSSGFSGGNSGIVKPPLNVASTSSNVMVEKVGVENRTVEIQTDYHTPESDEATISAVRSILNIDETQSNEDDEETESDNEESGNSEDPDWTVDEVQDTDKQKPTVVDTDKEPDWDQLKKRYDNKTKFKCKHCDKYIKGVIRYRTHVYGHTGVKPFACEHCPKRFTTPKTKKLHMMKHKGLQQFLCNLCGKGFSTNTGLKSHIAVHDKGGNVQVKCEYCPRVFTSRNRYEKHVEYKHPSQPFEFRCEECNRNFTTRRSLIRHNRSLHQNIKGHICEICGKAFYRKEYLKSHLTTHGGLGKVERNYTKRSYQVIEPDTNKYDIVLTSVETSTTRQVESTTSSTERENEVITTEYTIPLSAETHIALPSTTVENQMTVEPGYYITHTDDETQVAHMLVYEQPAVQYEVECGSSEQIDAAEALSAINMLAQASINQGY